MAGLADMVAAVDAFMASPKRIIGGDIAPTWGPGYNDHEEVMKYPLEVGGEQLGSQLMVVCFPHQRDLKFRIGILFSGMICRLDFTDETHSNTLDGVGMGLPPIVRGPHYHSWPLNKRFFRGVTKAPELHDAAPYQEPARTFDAVLRWFCTDTNIMSLPAGHRIELPALDRLV
jgi:hypothetical protein